MIIYSRKIVQFIKAIKRSVKDVLASEVGLKVYGDRFYDQGHRASYPIKVVIYNNKSMLGYFDANFLELGFHERLMHTSKEQLHNIIRHEVAHYLTFINYGDTIQSHGPEFRLFCQRMGWGEDVYAATICLENGHETSDKQESSVLRKVKKLMALTTSSNKNEAELAMIKSQQLLLKHNVEYDYFETVDEEKILLKRILKQKKIDAKTRSIARILETFFVSIVYNRAGEYTYVEILGNVVNIEIAEYVADVLNIELDKLWLQIKQQANLKGMVAKNSFFMGLAKGYCNKIQALKRDYGSDVLNALMVIEKKLIDAKAMAYPRLSSSKSSANHCQKSSALGEKMGRELSINPAINKASKGLKVLIGYFS